MKQATAQSRGDQEASRNETELVPLPLLFCRSSLFVASRNEVIPSFNKKLLFAYGTWQVSYTGCLLRQQELDVWMTCLRLVRKNKLPAGQPLVISRAQFLKEMGIQPNGRESSDLIQKLERLRSAMLTIEGPVSVTRANLLAIFNEENAEQVSTQDRIIIAFDPVFMPLLEDHIANVSVDIPLRLRRVLAKWLYRFASTCSGEFCVGIEKLRDWSGNSEDLDFYDPATKKHLTRKAMSLPDFRRALLDAIDEIKAVAPEEFRELSFERQGGEQGEGQLHVSLAKRPKVLIRKQAAPPPLRRGQNRGGVVL